MDWLLTRIEIDGFKSFYNFVLDLQPFQVIVGPNAAGKSNLFDALRLLARLAEVDLRTAFREIRGESGELFTILPDGTTVDTMRFAAELLLQPVAMDQWGRIEELKQTRVRYELHIQRSTDLRGLEQLRIVHESLVPIRAMVDTWAKHKRVGDWATLFRYWQRRESFISPMVGDIPTLTLHQDGRAGRKRQVVLDKLESTVLSGLNNAEFPHGFATREELRGWKYLQFSPEALRFPSSRLAPEQMDASGQYLANLLARLKKTDPFLLTDICTDLANLVPGIVKVDVEEDEARDRYVVWAQTADGRRFSSRVLSDGTLRLLALSSMRNDPEERGVLLFEEPENGVHPFRLKRVVPLLRGMTTQFEEGELDMRLKQLLVNTHSPNFVAHLSDSEIVFAHVADTFVQGQDKAMRVTRMVPVKDEEGIGTDHYTRLEMLRYLDERDLEAAAQRLRGDLP